VQQNGDLSVIQNVGYPNPARSHFRSQEIWQPFPLINIYWVATGLYNAKKKHQPVSNIDSIDNLTQSSEPNSILCKDPNRFVTKINWKMTASYRITHS
jgi:hypothetical protein